MKAKYMVKRPEYKFHVKNVCKSLIFCFVIFGVIIFTSSMVMAEYIEQPANESSTLATFDNNSIYDFEFAKLIEENIGNNSAEMIFIFGTCYGGGMIDDLDKLQNKSKLAATSASRHNESAFGGSNFGAWTDTEDYYKKAFHDAIEKNPNRNVSVLFEEANQTDVRGPNGAPVKEHPQKKFNGTNAESIKIGNQSDNATSFHAVLFVGADTNSMELNDLRRMNDLLIKKYGFTNDTIHVLALDRAGATIPGANVNGKDLPGVPVDDNATQNDLNETLKQIKPLMNTSEQFLFWADGHGDIHKVNRTITMVPHEFSVTYTVPIDPEMIDQWFEGNVGIFAEGVTSEEGALVYLNGEFLGPLSNTSDKTIFSFDPNLLNSENEIIIENACNPETIRITAASAGGTASGDEILMIESADSSGNKKDIFIEGDNVYSFGSGYGSNETYDLYIVKDRSWTDGMSITPYVIKMTISTDVNGDIVPDPTLIWSSAVRGKYDIIVDVEGNGNYDQNIDPLDDADVNDAGFEVPVLTPVGIIALIGLLLVVTMSRIKRR